MNYLVSLPLVMAPPSRDAWESTRVPNPWEKREIESRYS